jgi:hypothetical protein
VNLHALASPIIGIVNPNRIGVIRISRGYTTTASGKQVPAYDGPRRVSMQVQELSERDLRQVDNLNVAGSTHTIYLNGRLDGLVRPDNKGGDLIELGGRVYLVTALLEDWEDGERSGWCKVAATLQREHASA